MLSGQPEKGELNFSVKTKLELKDHSQNTLSNNINSAKHLVFFTHLFIHSTDMVEYSVNAIYSVKMLVKVNRFLSFKKHFLKHSII